MLPTVSLDLALGDPVVPSVLGGSRLAQSAPRSGRRDFIRAFLEFQNYTHRPNGTDETNRECGVRSAWQIEEWWALAGNATQWMRR